MESLINQVKQLTNGANTIARHLIAHQLRGLAAEIESPREAILRHTYSYTNAAACQVAVDLGLFKLLSESDGPLSTDAIAEKTEADPLLIRRILQMLASTHTVVEIDENVFTANNTTKALATPGGAAGVAHGFYFIDVCAREIPAHLKTHRYKSPNNAFDSPFQAAWKTDQHAFVWVQTQPSILGNFLAALPNAQGPSWTTVFPLESKLLGANSDPAAPVFVDIGGGIGGQCAAFLSAISDKYKGRVILQDLPQTLERASKIDGVEQMVQDFFEGQSSKGAAIYYLRNVLHDHPDKRCLDILKHQTKAMSSTSIILIDEIIVPNKGASFMATQSDISMMATLGAVERTEAHWRSLMDRAGLEIKQIYHYDPEIGWGLIEAVLKH